MKTFRTANIRNVALVGHRGRASPPWPRRCCSRRARSAGWAASRTAPRSATSTPRSSGAACRCRLALAPVELDGHKINLLDTPGYPDFVGDVAAALTVADLAVFVVSAVDGVEVQTEIAWRMADELGLPRDRVREQARPGAGVVRADPRPAQGARSAPASRRWSCPIGEEAEFTGRRRPARRHRRDLRRTDRPGHRGSRPRRHGGREHAVHDAARRGHRGRPTTT